MSHTTCFNGRLDITPDLTKKHILKLQEYYNIYPLPNSGFVFTLDSLIVEGDSNNVRDVTNWINALMLSFLIRWGYKLNGKLYWDSSDDYKGVIYVNNYIAESQEAQVSYPSPSWEK